MLSLVATSWALVLLFCSVGLWDTDGDWIFTDTMGCFFIRNRLGLIKIVVQFRLMDVLSFPFLLSVVSFVVILSKEWERDAELAWVTRKLLVAPIPDGFHLLGFLFCWYLLVSICIRVLGSGFYSSRGFD